MPAAAGESDVIGFGMGKSNTSSTSVLVFTVVAVAAVWGVVRVMSPGRPAIQQSVSLAPEAVRPVRTEPSLEPRITPPPAGPQDLSPQEDPAPSSKTAIEPTQLQSPPDPVAQNTAPAAPPAPRAKGGLQDPVARAALALVGVDAAAGQYWYQAINDPSLSAHERQDLIEDLNEDGLSDPQHPTMDDLPLILNRIDLIEAVRGDAMDQVNADAFAEAYKDLVNLAIQAIGND